MKKMLIGTVPPPVGGDAIWAEGLLNHYKLMGESISFVNTSLIGRRAETVDENRYLLDEIKRSLTIWKSIKETIKKDSPDLVHMNISCSPLGSIRDLFSARIVKKYKKRLILHCHCNVEDQIGKRFISRAILRLLLQKADGIIVLNSKSSDYVNRIVDVKTVIIPNFVEEQSIGIERTAFNEVGKVLFVGHIRKTKGINEIFSVAQAFTDWSFLLVGPITDDYPEFYPGQTIGNIHLLGETSHEQVRLLMDTSDVFLFPSHTEGFSVALLEAMARGLPCIVTDVGANADMIEGKGGYVVDVNSVNELISALNRIKSSDTRITMSKWNICKVKKCYTIESVVQRLEQFYNEVCK